MEWILVSFWKAYLSEFPSMMFKKKKNEVRLLYLPLQIPKSFLNNINK